MGEVAYKLELPEGLSGVHDVFHVSPVEEVTRRDGRHSSEGYSATGSDLVG